MAEEGRAAADLIADFVIGRVAEASGCLIIGLCGPQGIGKSTATQAAAARLSAAGLPTATLSIDDFYRPAAERRALAARIPLLRTRGVPGTHDTALALSTLTALRRGETVHVPQFDKLADDRSDATRTVPGATRVVLFEGWCVGAHPETAAALAVPVNDLEAEQDRDGHWRHHVNAMLEGPYRQLWAMFDALVMLRAADLANVPAWRAEQEASAELGATGTRMSPAELSFFLKHYERLTRHIDREMPARADLVLTLDRDRTVTEISRR